MARQHVHDIRLYPCVHPVFIEIKASDVCFTPTGIGTIPPQTYHSTLCAIAQSILYSQPESSAHWSLHLSEVLKVKMGGIEFPNMPSIWRFESSRMIMSVYVDDLILGGNKSSHSSFRKELQKYINLDPFTEFGRVLGRGHQLVNGELILGCFYSPFGRGLTLTR